MSYQVNAKNVSRKDLKKKRIKTMLSGFGIVLMLELFVIYNFLNYCFINGVEANISSFILSFSMLFIPAWKLPLNFETIKTILQIFFSFWYITAIVFLLLSLKIKKIGNFKGVEHGSADWGNSNNPMFKNEVNTIPLANEIHIDPKNNSLKNLHEIVIGDTGAGKSFTKVIPDVLQFTGNYIIADVKGSLYRQLAYVLKQNGYDVKVLNVKDIKYSNTFNPLNYVTTDDEIMELVETFRINSRDDVGSSGDQFWEDTMVMLLTSVITYLVRTDGEQKTFPRVVDLITSLEVHNGKILASCEYERLIKELEIKQPLNSAVLLYKQFKQSASETLSSILISTTSRLRIWNLEEVRILTNSDEMDINTFMERKTAIFLIVKPNNKAYKVITSMYLSVLFNRLFTIAEKKYGGKLPTLLNLELDEFANLGKINDFDSVLTTARSFNIRIVPFVQAIQQIEKLYDKADKTIISNCAVFNYLGTGDDKTKELIVKKLGKTTIDEMNVSKNTGKQGGGSHSDRNLGRDLLTLDEMGRLNTSPTGNSILFVDDIPYFCEKYKTVNHPLFNMIGNDIQGSEGYKNNTYIEQSYEELYQSHKKQYDEYTNKFNKKQNFIVFADDNTGGSNDQDISIEQSQSQEQGEVREVTQEEFERNMLSVEDGQFLQERTNLVNSFKEKVK